MILSTLARAKNETRRMTLFRWKDKQRGEWSSSAATQRRLVSAYRRRKAAAPFSCSGPFGCHTRCCNGCRIGQSRLKCRTRWANRTTAPRRSIDLRTSRSCHSKSSDRSPPLHCNHNRTILVTHRSSSLGQVLDNTALRNSSPAQGGPHRSNRRSLKRAMYRAA